MARAEPCSARCSCGLRSKRRAACRLPQRARLAARRCATRSAQRGYRGPRHRAVETGEGRMRTPDSWIVVGLDCGGTSNNATVLDASGRFLVDRLVETPSLVQQGPDVAVEALVRALDQILERTGMVRASVRALGLDTPGPASADGVISSKGATNFSQPAWRGFDFRGALQARVGLPVVYSTTPTPRRCMPTTCISEPTPRSTPPSPLSWVLGWAVVSSRPAGSCGGPPGWPASWATSTSRCRDCSAKDSRCPAATAASSATPRASPPWAGSRGTCCPIG